MPKRGKHLLTSGGGEDAEPIVTYSRLSAEESALDDGRIEPHFTAVRVDAPRDPMAEVSAGEIRQVRRRRGPGVLALAGVVALVAGAGVLAAAYNGIAGLDTPNAPSQVAEVAATQPTVLAAAEPAALAPVAVDATGRTVRVVSADKIPPPYSETAALAPAPTADPAAGSAGSPGQAEFSGETAQAAEPPGRVITDPPPPRLRPITASFSPPQSATPEAEAMAAVVPNAGLNAAPVVAVPVNPAAPLGAGGTEVDAALASVDRILAGQQPAGDYVDGSGDGEFYGPVEPIVQPLPYPVLEPVTNAGQLYPAGEPYGPYYPGQGLYAGQPVYPGDPQPLQPGIDLAADEAPAQPWWLPKRRALIIPNAPVPPAEVPNARGTLGAW